VADALVAQLGVDVDRRKLDLHGHIKNVGEHTIDVRIYEDVKVQLVLNVVPEGGAPVAAAAAPAAVEPEVEPEAESEPEVAEEAAVEDEVASDESTQDEA
ncbi:hypothetical protein EG835_10855, partial [bacterium]|nr:hypothetical protein [bacterium]